MDYNLSSYNKTSMPTGSGTIALYAGPSIAIFFSLIGFIAFVINRSLRIKRQHIISINICLSLIVYNLGFLISMFSAEKIPTREISSGCIAGSIVVMLGWFCLHFWVLANWIYLSFIIRLRVSRHISQFLIKSTLPTYGCAILFLLMILVMTTTHQEDQQIYNQFFCWFDLADGNTTEWVFGLATAIFAFGVIISALVCLFELACKTGKNPSVSTMKKNKRILARLSVLTLIVFFTSASHLSWWVLSKKPNSEKNWNRHIKRVLKLEEDYEWLKIFQGVFIGIEGIAATLYLIVPADDFQSLLSYCTAMIKCQDPTAAQNRNFSSTMRSSKQLENNNILDIRDSMASDERPVKFVPREEIASDFGASSKDMGLYTNTFPMEKNRAKARASTLKQERNGSGGNKPKETSNLVTGSKSNTKKRGIRASFRLPTKSSSSSGPDPASKSATSPGAAAVNKYRFNRESKISMTKEHERKTSF